MPRRNGDAPNPAWIPACGRPGRRAGNLDLEEALCDRLPDLPKATIYRQVDRLRQGRVFQVESKRRVRGAVERSYRLARRGALVAQEEARAMTWRTTGVGSPPPWRR